MKKIIIFIGIILALFSCQQEVFNDGVSNECLLFATVHQYTPTDTRLVVSEEDEMAVVKWKSGDKLGIFGASLSNSAYLTSTLQEGTTSKTSDFAGTVMQSQEYYAFYPYIASSSSKEIMLKDLAIQDVKSNSWEGISEMLSMVSDGKSKPDNENRIEFTMKHICSIVELKIKSKNTPFALKQFTMSGNGIMARALLNIEDGSLNDVNFSGVDSQNFVTVNVSDLPKIGTDEFTTVRFVIYTVEQGKGKIVFNFYIDNGLGIPVVMDVKEDFVPGKRYIKELVLDASTAIEVWDGGQEEPTKSNSEGFIMIENAKQLAWMSANMKNIVGMKFIQMADIDLGSRKWATIGTMLSPFEGVFNGNGKKIYNLNVPVGDTFTIHKGLFGCIENSDISNVNIMNGNVLYGIAVTIATSGGVCGYAHNSSIINCYNNATVYIRGAGVLGGGICGFFSNDIANIISCTNDGSVVVSSYEFDAYAGGICGMGDVEDCFNNGSVSIKSGDFDAYAGGISGSGSVARCVNRGKVISKAQIEGVAGGIVGIGGYVVDNVNWGAVYTDASHSYAGGICGRPYTVVSGCTNFGDVCAYGESYGVIGSLTAVYAGGICAHIEKVKIVGCENHGSVYAQGEKAREIQVYAGGITGYDTWVTACFNTGNVSAKSSTNSNDVFAGGIVGLMFFYNYPYIIGSYSVAQKVESSASKAGGLSGSGFIVEFDEVINSYWLHDGPLGITQGYGEFGNTVGENNFAMTVSQMRDSKIVQQLNAALPADCGFKYGQAVSERENQGYPILIKK